MSLPPPQARILDTTRSVVALHRQRVVFPISLAVTKLSGTGADCVFVGVLRPGKQVPLGHGQQARKQGHV